MEKSIIIISEQCVLNLNNDTVSLNGITKPLKGQTGRLIHYLATNRGQYLTRDQIYRYVFQDEYYETDDETSLSRKLDNLLYHIKIRVGEELRNCIKKSGTGGYYFQSPSDGIGHALSAELNFAQNEILGREDELKRISLLVNEGHKPIVIWGEGGIGKTELALKFCKGFGPSKCHFVRYHVSIKNTIAGLSFSNPPENHKKLSVEEKFEKHIKWLKEYDDTHLLILDNFDDDSKTLAELLADPDLARICQLRIKLIITTRNKPQFPMPNTIHLESLPEIELLKLIKRYYQRWEADGTTDDELIALIRALDGHTLCCELAAKTLHASHKLKPKDVLESLHGNNNEDSLVIVDTEKDRRGYSGRITDHIKKLYAISSLTFEEIETMRYMLLISPSGIDHSLLLDVNFGIQQAPLQALIKKGWLSKAQNTDLITIHPVVRSFCMLTPELQPALIEEQFLDFIDNLYAFAGHPSDRSTYFHFKLHTPYNEWANEDKMFYRQWKQVDSTMRFLVESVGQFVPAPVTIEQAKSYFDYADTFLRLRQERNGPLIPWERYTIGHTRYLNFSSLGSNLAFCMRQLAFELLHKNLPNDDLFLGKAYDHLGRSYDSMRAASNEELHKNKLIAKDCFEEALGIYLRCKSMYVTEVFLLYKRLSNNFKVDHEKQLSYAQSAVALIDEYSLAIPLDCAKLCKHIAYRYKERAVHNPDADVQWLLRAERKWCVDVSKPFNAKLCPAQMEDVQNALHWLMREEHEYLSVYADIMDEPSVTNQQASQKNARLADLYKRIAYIYCVLNNFEKELEYRLCSLQYACGLQSGAHLSREIIDEYCVIAQCQQDLKRYSDCLETCHSIIASICSRLHVSDKQGEGQSSCSKEKHNIQYYAAEFIAATFMAIHCCCELEQYEKAIVFWNALEGLDLQDHKEFDRFRLSTYINMSICYAKQMDIEKQYDFEIKVLDIKRNNGMINLQDFLDKSIKIAINLIDREQFATARSYLLRIITTYDEHSSQENIQINPKVYMAMAQCLQKLGNIETALVYALIYAEATGKKRYAKFLRWLRRLFDK